MKLTEESYVLEAKYTWESAEADAENAEYIRTYQTNVRSSESAGI